MQSHLHVYIKYINIKIKYIVIYKIFLYIYMYNIKKLELTETDWRLLEAEEWGK